MRPVEMRPSRRRGTFDLIDSGGVAECVLTVSPAVAFVISLMDGSRSRGEIQAQYMRRYGRLMFTDELDGLIEQLDRAWFLEGPALRRRIDDLTEAYRSGTSRPIRNVESLGAPADRLGDYLADVLSDRSADSGSADGRWYGLVAPHLDYARGRPCYASSYRGLGGVTNARRFVILGTNHFGRSSSVVGTRKDFDTPFGVVPCDRDLIDRLQARCGADLCAAELDHAREHSIELQVVLLRHALGDRPFTIAPFLCPDPCRPSGTAPAEGVGVDLAVFAGALAAEIAEDDSIFIIAGADLSHVGRYFQDDRALDAESLAAVEASDRAALGDLVRGDARAFVSRISAAENDTNICSVGCLFAAATALGGLARPRLLHYHQAVTPEMQNCVTCASMAFVGGG